MKKFLLGMIFCLFVTFAYGQIKCRISGRVIERPQSKVLILQPELSDNRVVKPVEIPIINGNFSCEFEAPGNIAYELIFEDELKNGSWMPVNFMAEAGGVEFELYPQERNSENVVKGGSHNDRYKFLTQNKYFERLADSLDKRMNSLQENHLYYSVEGERLYKEMDQAFNAENKKLCDSLNEVIKCTQMLSDDAMQVNKEYSKISEKAKAWKLSQIEASCDAAGLAVLNNILFWEITRQDKLDDGYKDKAIGIYNEKYRQVFSDNYSAKQIELLLIGNETVVGGMYKDFEAPDVVGKMHRLSAEIAGKIAVIDLWASWCGPCMKMSASIVPIYEKYKDKGFTVVGVAREMEDTKAMEKAIARLKLPWLNLVDVGDRHNIWRKYGVGNGGGGVFLVDASGKIVAINPTTQQIEEYLAASIKSSSVL